MISPLGDLILDAGGDDFFRNHSDSFEHFQGVLVIFWSLDLLALLLQPQLFGFFNCSRASLKSPEGPPIFPRNLGKTCHVLPSGKITKKNSLKECVFC